MRRKLAGIAIATAGVSMLGIVPAHSQQPVDIIITEGIGLVCEAADLKSSGIGGVNEKNLYGQYRPNDYQLKSGGNANNPADYVLKAGATRDAWCNYPGNGNPGGRNPAGTPNTYDPPVTPGTQARPEWWGPAAGSAKAENAYTPTKQGLFLPGVGPGARGPYSLNILPLVSDTPANNCVSTLGGQGCGSRLVGKLTPAPVNGFGAHAGSSQGVGVFSFVDASGSLNNRGTLGWNNSAATVLPLTGSITHGNTGVGKSIVGFSSSRGVTGQDQFGNAGVSNPTSGFQVEGMLVIY